LGYWSVYFLGKVGLFYAQVIGFNWFLNLLFAVAVMWPLPHARYQRWRAVAAWPVALSLLYYDSWLPPLSRALSQAKLLAGFSAEYLLELGGRFINLKLLGLVALGLVVYVVLRKRIRFATLAMLGILSVPASSLVVATTGVQAGSGLSAQGAMVASTDGSAGGGAGGAGSTAAPAMDPSAQLASFYAEEAKKKINFTAQTDQLPFDFILLHICSIAWDDLDFVGDKDPALLKRFDVVFRNFNTAASYSGPASIRVLRSTCGQTSHKELYKGGTDQCYLFGSLETAGFESRGLLNHDGVFDEFGKMLSVRGGMTGKIEDNRWAPVHQQSFDGTPIYDDYELLSKWWAKREAGPTKRMALYYNSISLHDGNRLKGFKSNSSLETYKPRVTKLLNDLDRFVSQLESSGRPVVLMLVPEHGASLRGDKVQIAGLREIPSPRITLAPAAIKIIGLKKPEGAAAPRGVEVTKPISHFGLTTLLADLLANNPYASGAKPLADRIAALPTTQAVSENEELVVMRRGDGYVMRSGDGTWVPYRE
jgi:cellulose synthase operon protein YhjU